MAKLKAKDFIESLKLMNIKEVMELVEAMKEEWGIDPTAVAAAPAGGAAGGDAAPTEVSVIIKSPGGTKIAVIKAIKEITGAGLMDAKKMAETADSVIKADIKPEEAADIKAKLEAAGAVIEVK